MGTRNKEEIMKREEPIYKRRIADDFNDGKELLQNLENNITMFGSARTAQSDQHAILAQKLAYNLAQRGINIISGGGKGIMEAANRGAYKSNNAESIGLSIKLPFEDSSNPYTTRNLMFNYFFSRK